MTAKARNKIWHQQLIHLSLGEIPNAYNYVNGETAWILLSDAQTEMYPDTTPSWKIWQSRLLYNQQSMTITVF